MEGIAWSLHDPGFRFPCQAIENIEADKVVELFPGLLETLQEPAMLLYDVTWWTNRCMLDLAARQPPRVDDFVAGVVLPSFWEMMMSIPHVGIRIDQPV